MELYFELQIEDANRLKDLLSENEIDFEFRQPKTKHENRFDVSLGRFQSITTVELWANISDFEKIEKLLSDKSQDVNYEKLYADDFKRSTHSDKFDINLQLNDARRNKGAFLYFLYITIITLTIYLISKFF